MSGTEILERALSLLQDGETWIKGRTALSRAHQATCYCLLGSVQAASHPHRAARLVAVTRLQDAIVRRFPERAARPLHWKADPWVGEILVRFNDAPETIFEDVQSIFSDALSME